jgi:excisionase family DNA binding protein
MSRANRTPDVLTIEEVADYLRVPTAAVEREVRRGHIPGRRIEDTWRFLRAAIDDWLGAHDARSLLLEQAGVFAADQTLEPLRAAIYAERGRPEADPRV